MVDKINLYISAAADLEIEREILGRAVPEIPVTLGWRIVQSPIRGEPADLEAAATADLHLLLLGGDIRAPVGLEWLVARRAGKLPALFLKQGILRTPAALEFIRTIATQAAWRRYKDGADLRQHALKLLADHILERALYYVLRPEELERLQAWRSELDASGVTDIEETRGGAGESGLILSPERYIPSGGVLIQPIKGEEAD
jgi:hypothetical protein